MSKLFVMSRVSLFCSASILVTIPNYISAMPLDFTLIDGTFTMEDGKTTRSAEYDPELDGFVMIDRNDRDNSYLPAFHTITANAIFDGNPATFGHEGPNKGVASFHSNSYNKMNQFPDYEDLAVFGSNYYAMDSCGTVAQIAKDTLNVINSVTISPENRCGSLQAMCMDSMSQILYVVGDSKVYSVPLASFGTNQGNVVFDGETRQAVDMDELNPRDFYPWDCTVVNGDLYLLDLFSFAIGVYDVGYDLLTYHPDKVDGFGSSIDSYNGYLMVLTTDNKVWVGDASDITQTFEVALNFQMLSDEGLSSIFPHDLGVDEVNGILSIVMDRNGLLPINELAFYDIDELVTRFPTSGRPTAQPTFKPTSDPTTA